MKTTLNRIKKQIDAIGSKGADDGPRSIIIRTADADNPPDQRIVGGRLMIHTATAFAGVDDGTFAGRGERIVLPSGRPVKICAGLDPVDAV